MESNPYEVMFMARAPALPGDRAENHKRALANAKERAAKERAYFDDAKNVEAFTRPASATMPTSSSAGNKRHQKAIARAFEGPRHNSIKTRSE